jgi:hypothetical protein
MPKLARDFCVNVLAGLVVAAVVYLVGVANDALPTYPYVVLMASFYVLMALELPLAYTVYEWIRSGKLSLLWLSPKSVEYGGVALAMLSMIVVPLLFVDLQAWLRFLRGAPDIYLSPWRGGLRTFETTTARVLGDMYGGHTWVPIAGLYVGWTILIMAFAIREGLQGRAQRQVLTGSVPVSASTSRPCPMEPKAATAGRVKRLLPTAVAVIVLASAIGRLPRRTNSPS